MKRFLLPIMLMVFAALVFNGCGKKDGEDGNGGAGGGKGEIKIGAVFAVTGGASLLGGPEKNTAEMLEKQINEKGGIGGRKVRILVEDTEGSEDKTREEALKLITKENVCVLIGPTRSGSSVAIKDIVNDKEVPNISCAAAMDIVVPVKDSEWVFKVPQTDEACAMKILENMKSKGITKIGIITGTTGFGKAGAEQLRKLAPDYGVEIVADETYPHNETDVTAQLSKIKAAEGVQAVVNWSIVPTQALIAQQMEQVELDVQLYQSHGYGNIDYVKKGGDAANGTIFPGGALLVVDQLSDDHPRKELLMKYKNDYESMFNEPVSTFGGHAYDSLMIAFKAIEAVGTDREKIRDYIETINGDNSYSGTAGVFNMTPNDHCGLDDTAFEMIIVKDGKFVLYTEE